MTQDRAASSWLIRCWKKQYGLDIKIDIWSEVFSQRLFLLLANTGRAISDPALYFLCSDSWSYFTAPKARWWGDRTSPSKHALTFPQIPSNRSSDFSNNLWPSDDGNERSATMRSGLILIVASSSDSQETYSPSHA